MTVEVVAEQSVNCSVAAVRVTGRSEVELRQRRSPNAWRLQTSARMREL
jgi:hypothetical protein